VPKYNTWHLAKILCNSVRVQGVGFAYCQLTRDALFLSPYFNLLYRLIIIVFIFTSVISAGIHRLYS